MALVLPNQAEKILLEALVNKTAPQNLVLKLYKNDVTPSETDTEATYAEATFTGYSAVTLTASNWTVTEGAPTQASYPQVTFTSTADSQNQSIYGYYLVQAISGKLVWAEKFSNGPYTIQNNGDAIKVTPTISAD